MEAHQSVPHVLAVKYFSLDATYFICLCHERDNSNGYRDAPRCIVPVSRTSRRDGQFAAEKSNFSLLGGHGQSWRKCFAPRRHGLFAVSERASERRNVVGPSCGRYFDL